jgi:hypothetical protein
MSCQVTRCKNEATWRIPVTLEALFPGGAIPTDVDIDVCEYHKSHISTPLNKFWPGFERMKHLEEAEV